MFLRDLICRFPGRVGPLGALPALAWALGTAVLVAGAAEAQAPYVTITDADCKRLARHIPDADVTYQPGVDVRGKAVAPADLGANDPGGTPDIILPRAVLIPIEVDLFDRFGIPPGGANFDADAFIGEVTVDLATGEAYFNGQPLQSEAEAELAVRCQRIIRNRRNGN